MGVRRLSNENSCATVSAMDLATSTKPQGVAIATTFYPSEPEPTSWTHSSYSSKLPARRLRPVRATQRPARYTFDVFDGESEQSEADHGKDPPSDTQVENQHSASEDWQTTNFEVEEDARIKRSMGVIRKNAASRGTEGGTKYHCDVCSIDITSTVRLFCPERCFLTPETDL